MRDYSYQEMLKMQEDAARRVREMKKRAAIVASEEESPPKENKSPLPDEVKRISMPVELPQEDRKVDCEQTTTPEEIKEHHSHAPDMGIHGLIKFFSNDQDALLILAVLAVISQEKTDYMTSLALLYLLL